MKTWIYTLIFFIGMVQTSCLTRQPKIGFLIHAYDSPRWHNDEKYFTDEIKRLKGKALTRDAGNDQNIQINQAGDLIREGISVLVVIPVDQYAAGRIVNLAHDHGIKVIAYDRMINNCQLDYYVSADNIKIGELQAKLISRTVHEGKYALIGGPLSDNNSQMIYVGQMNILDPLVDKGDISIAFKGFAKTWSTDEGYRLALMALDSTKNNLNAMLCGNDAMAIGVIKALKERGLAGKVAVAGQDADLRNIQEIVSGNQSMTVFKKIKTMATTAAELAMDLSKNKPIAFSDITIDNGNRLIPSYLVDAVPVNESNIKLTVVAEGYQQENEIFKKH